MTIPCPAKVNLTLEVLDRRSDGYHGIRSVMVPLALADELEIAPHDTFAFRCDDALLENDANLVVRAVRSIADEPPVAVHLRKRVPYEAGLGSGSSDAAGVLRAAMAGAFGPLDGVDWLARARQLGSDVPFFLTGSGALVEGTGERVTALGALPEWHVLVVKPPVPVSTAEAYAELDRHPRPSRPRSSSVSLAMVAAVQRRDFPRVQQLLCNDFEPVVAARTPEVAVALEALRDAGAERPLLAGSGSAVFALFENARSLERLDERLRLPKQFLRFRTRFMTADGWRG